MIRRKVCYVTGTRADFGLMQSTLQQIHHSNLLELSMIVTGMHLLPEYGFTVSHIEAAGLPIGARIEIEKGIPSGALMAKNIGQMLIGLVEQFELIRPNIVMVLGDRGEMLAGALAAIHLNIPVVHIHGGERSGTVDEPVRHAISKLAHFHFVATDESKSRLVRMGEAESSISVVGAPGIDGLLGTTRANRATLCATVGFDPTRRIALMVYHPVLQEADRSGAYVTMIVDVLLAKGYQVMAIGPNSDAGSAEVRMVLEARASAGEIRLATHLQRDEYLSWLAASDILIGNSSSGIIEAATFGTPVVNVGSRQNLRQRNSNVVDCSMDRDGIEAAVELAKTMPRSENSNVYGDGRSGERIAELLASIDLSQLSMAKVNVY